MPPSCQARHLGEIDGGREKRVVGSRKRGGLRGRLGACRRWDVLPARKGRLGEPRAKVLAASPGTAGDFWGEPTPQSALRQCRSTEHSVQMAMFFSEGPSSMVPTSTRGC